MTNPLTEFTKRNITEIILGLAIAIILVLLMDLNFEESMTVILLGPLVALVFNKLLESIVPNVKNQRMALVIVGVVGLILLVQQFNVGVFSADNVNAESFVEVPDEPQFAITGAILTGVGAIVGGIAKLPFLIIFILVLVFLLFNPATMWIGILLLAVIGIPALFVLGTGVFLIAQNFTLILILIGGYAILSLIFRKPIEKQALKK